MGERARVSERIEASREWVCGKALKGAREGEADVSE
jgi:hypothetical protein